MPRPLSRDLARLAVAGLLGAALTAGYVAVRVWQQGQIDESGHSAEAIVVLGAAQYDGRPSPVFRARLDHAIDLFDRTDARWFVTTGGKQPGDRFTEAAAARRYAESLGVPGSAILSETTGRDTLDSLRNVARLFAGRHIRSALFVSDRSHMLRVLRMAQDLGIEAYGSPATSGPLEREPLAYLDQVVHEMGALGLYFATR